jgi:hypothetical protein
MSNLRIALGPKYNENRIRNTLELCRDYFEQRADAEYFTDSASPCGNEEMQLLVDVEDALRRVGLPNGEVA